MLNTTVPKISVIVPVYKVENYLHRCIDSILAQSYADFELLLIDDGSPDNSGQICDEYAAKDSRVRVFHKGNGGVSSARNLGLDNARGEWITFIDSDDYVDVDYLYELFFSAKEYNADFVTTIEPGIQIDKKETYLLFEDFNILFTYYKMDCGPTPWAKLFKADIITNKNIRFRLNIHHGEDSIFVYYYLLEIKDIVLISSSKYFYDRSRVNSLSKTVHSYESALVTKQEFDRIFALMKTKMPLEVDGINNLNRMQVALVGRVLKSIMQIPKRKDRLEKFSEMDWNDYNRNKIPGTWKESFLIFLLKKRYYYLYDVLMYYYFRHK